MNTIEPNNESPQAAAYRQAYHAALNTVGEKSKLKILSAVKQDENIDREVTAFIRGVAERGEAMIDNPPAKKIQPKKQAVVSK